MDIFPFQLIAVLVLLLLLWRWFNRSIQHIPPCPSIPLPIIGHLFAFSSDRRSQMKEWHKQCGDIYSLYLGSKLMVVLNGYDPIKETLMKRGDEFSDRPFNILDVVLKSSQKGIVSSSGLVWKEQRGVALQILRNFGLGQNMLAERIQEEMTHFVCCVADNDGKPTDIRLLINTSTANIMASILFGQRFEYTDLSFQKLITYLSQLATDFDAAGIKFIDKSQSGEENFISSYLEERKKRQKSGNTTMDDVNLKRALFDLFAGGTETTGTTIYFFILYTLNHPNVQNKIFEEINEIIGADRSPTIQDRPKLTYLNAAIMETQRLASILPQSFPHTCTRDVSVRGYTIPKGSLIMPCLDSVLHDEKIWGHDVMIFRPERFIDHDGQLKNYDELIPFSVGRRACLGESLAKTELFLYLANMVQTFEFLPVDPDHPPPVKYKFGITVSPDPYKVRAVKRLH
ncbi:Cytochrome P450 2C3 [Bulinus truncatus]|nr:Cytochrome P450 2C3 [Bulinus truncatus]